MRVTLIYAKSQTLASTIGEAYHDTSRTKGEMSRDEIYPPLGILTLAAELERIGGYEIRIADDCLDDLESIKDAMRWAEVVGISAMTPNARRARELGRISRQEIGRFTILGGPHPTTNPEYFLDAGAADICVQAEGDHTLPEILQAVDRPETWDQVPGITFRKDGQNLATPRRELVRKLDELPWPAYHMIDMPRYFDRMVTPGITVMTSRGCPYSCTFCDAEMTPRTYRGMSPENTVDLFEHLLTTYNPPQIFLVDDLFTIQRKRVIGICQEIVRRGLSFEWTCESRVDTVDFEMLRWMRRAGCVKIYYGLESGSPEVLVTMKKDVTPEKIIRGARLTREVGMYFKFFILYGFPSDTAKAHRETEELVRLSKPDGVTVSILSPIPGTVVYEELKDQLLHDVADVEFHYWHHTEMFKHPNFTHAELQAERDRLLKLQARVRRSWRTRLGRKWERLQITLRKPVLLLDFIDILRRKHAHKRRIARQWGERLRRRDQVQMQIPMVNLESREFDKVAAP